MSQSGTVTEGLFRDDQLIGEGRDRPVTPISKITSGIVDHMMSHCTV